MTYAPPLWRPDRPRSGRTESAALPTDLVADTSRRLVTGMLVIAAISAVYLILFATAWRDRWELVGATGNISLLISSLIGAWLVRRNCAGQRALIRIGLGYEVLLCLDLSVIEFNGELVEATPIGAAHLISWTAVVIAFFPVLCPAPRRATVVASLVAAAMGPIGWAIASATTGRWVVEPGWLLGRWLPPFLAVALAWVAARFIGRLSAEVNHARRLGSYELLERLGHGGMGEVWRARHQLLARPAAIKLIKVDGGQTAEHIDRFEREAQVTASLQSAHTVALYDFGVGADGTFYYVMELLTGVDLEQLVARSGPLPPERVIYLLSQVADSLEEAHARGLIHRDIKPANIHVGWRAGRCDFVKVLDFGLVKQLDGAKQPVDSAVSRVGQLVGTPAYMAPEMVTGETLDARCDLYALGCAAYYALTGTPVFSEPTPMKTAVAHVSKQPEPPSSRGGVAIPAELERLVMDCLAKDPGQRPASAAEIARRLAAIPLAEPWTAERADAWWQSHPAAAAPAPAPAASTAAFAATIASDHHGARGSSGRPTTS